MKRLVRWAVGGLVVAYILIPASIGLMHSFGAWWGALIAPLLVALLVAAWWVIDNAGRG